MSSAKLIREALAWSSESSGRLLGTSADAEQRRERRERLIAAIREAERLLATEKAEAAAAQTISPEVRALLLEYRELVNSRSKAAQIDAIVGERTP